jgi:tetratricopeptide (TPR) repeat protein
MEDQSLRARLLRAIDLHRSGFVKEAIDGYRNVLREAPRQFDALRLLGAALLADRRAQDGVAYLEQAAAARPEFAEVWGLLGQCLAASQRAGEACDAYERAVRLRPDDVASWSNWGLQCDALGRHVEAIEHFDRALALVPQSAEIWSNRGIALGQAKRFEEALASQQRAVALRRDSAPIWCNLGKALNDLDRHHEAVESFDRALELAPDSASALSSRCTPLRALGRLEEALACCERALQISASTPSDAGAWSVHGALLAELHRHAEAIPSLERAAALAPSDAQTQFNRGLLYLTLGRLEDGWAGYEWRTRLPGHAGSEVAGRPTWDGREPLTGRVLLLTCEQGLGDSIQFSRFVPLLEKRGARIVLAVPAALRSLMQTLSPQIHVVTDGDEMPRFDLQCSLLSLPHRLGTTLASVPADVPYLSAPPPALERWQRRLGTPGRPRVGVVCSGNPRHSNDRNRSIALAHFAALQDLDLEMHLLQKDLREEDCSWMSVIPVIDHRDQLHDFADTAALTACMDLIVSVDTSVAHLAGAMGVPVIVLLPAAPDWRWMLERADSPWYPTARLLRQPVPGDWTVVIEALREAIEDHCSSAARTRAITPDHSFSAS